MSVAAITKKAHIIIRHTALPDHFPISFWAYSTMVRSGNLTPRPAIIAINSEAPKKDTMAEAQASCSASAVVSTGSKAITTVVRIINSMYKSWRLAIFSVVVFGKLSVFILVPSLYIIRAVFSRMGHLPGSLPSGLPPAQYFGPGGPGPNRCQQEVVLHIGQYMGSQG